MTMKLHKEVDHKNSESITNFTSFFNQRNRHIGEKMFPMLRSTSIRRFLHHITRPDTSGQVGNTVPDNSGQVELQCQIYMARWSYSARYIAI